MCIRDSDKGDNAVRLYLIQRFHKEIVVDQQIVLVVPLVMQFIVPKWDITYGEVKGVVRKSGIFKTGYCDIRIGIELLGDTARDAVQLHAIQAAPRHALRQ